jgi:hypothetical protein
LWHGRGYDRWFAAFSFGFFWFGLGGALAAPAFGGVRGFAAAAATFVDVAVNPKPQFD